MIKQKLINWLLRNTLRSVIPTDVITIERDKSTQKVVGAFLGHGRITESELRQLKEEVLYLKNTRIWSIMQNTLADQARRTIFELSENFDDVKSGKLMLYNLSVQNNILRTVEEYGIVKKQ